MSKKDPWLVPNTLPVGIGSKKIIKIIKKQNFDQIFLYY